jgi:hypothetical protein
VDLGELGRFDDALEGDVRILQGDVGADGRAEEKRVLRNVGDLRAQPLARQLGERAAVVGDVSRIRDEQPGGDGRERRLAGARRTDDGDERSRLDAERRIGEGRSDERAVAEGDDRRPANDSGRGRSRPWGSMGAASTSSRRSR